MRCGCWAEGEGGGVSRRTAREDRERKGEGEEERKGEERRGGRTLISGFSKNCNKMLRMYSKLSAASADPPA